MLNKKGRVLMNILSIGNSFSQDAQRYLYGIARAEAEPLATVNLYIGGCSLERHYDNMKDNVRDYALECNGQGTGFPMSIEEALINRAWDVVTLQQVSSSSTHPETYHPYLEELASFVRKKAPSAKIFIHQTWAYEEGCDRLHSIGGFLHASDMLAAVKDAYAKAVKDIDADGIIPSGELFGAMLDAGIPKIHRDTFHASLGLGRYALGLLWYRVLVGKSVLGNDFRDFDEPISKEEIALAKACVELTAQKYGY